MACGRPRGRGYAPLSIAGLQLTLFLVSGCVEKLDPEVIERLVIGSTGPIALEPELELKPGSIVDLRVGYLGSQSSFTPVRARVVWSFDRESRGITVDPVTGRLRVDPSVAEGNLLKVRANVELGRRWLEMPVRVFLPAENPLVGSWEEAGQLACGDRSFMMPEMRILELRFRAGGQFSVTWTPFESHRDYWGTYRFDSATGRLSLEVEGGNYVPADLRPEGTAMLEGGGGLRLQDLWLGRPAGAKGIVRCGHVFRR